MRKTTVLVLALTFVTGLIAGAVATTGLPELGFVRFYERWGLWGLIGRIAIGVLLVGMPITYIGWLVGSAIQAMRPSVPGRAIPVLEVEGKRPRTVKRILVPAGGGRNARMGLRLAAQLAQGERARLTLMRVLPVSAEGPTFEAQQTALRNMATEVLGLDYDVDIRVRVSVSVVRAIVDEVRLGEYDLLVVGASDNPSVRRLFFGSIPHALAEEAPCPVVIVRATPV